MSATNTTTHGLSQYVLGDSPEMDDLNNDNAIIEQGLQAIDDHIAAHDNPHGVTKTQLGLGNVDNTSDANKPVSTAQQAALNALAAAKIDKTAIVNDLTTGGADKVLSADQGVILNNSKADQPYQQHTQTDGGWHVEDSAGGLVADAVISGNTSQDGIPTPDNPITPVCLAKGTEIDVICSNFLDISQDPASEYYSTHSLNGDVLTVVDDGLSSAPSRYVLKMPVVPNTNYYVSLTAQQSNVYDDVNSFIYIREEAGGGAVINSKALSKTTNSQEITFTFNSGTYHTLYFWFYVRPNVIADRPNTIIYSDVMVSPQNIPYEPYTNSCTLVTPCDLWKVVEVVDKWNLLTGQVLSKSQKNILNGTGLTWVFSAYTTTTIASFSCNTAIPGANHVERPKILCDKFHVSTNGDNSETEHIRNSSASAGYPDTVFIFIAKSRLSGWDDSLTNAEKVVLFKTWLAANPVTVWYESQATVEAQYIHRPITLPKGMVNVIVNSGNGVLPFEISMLYRQDLKAYIKSIVNGVYDTLATNITDLTVRVTELETAGGD